MDILNAVPDLTEVITETRDPGHQCHWQCTTARNGCIRGGLQYIARAECFRPRSFDGSPNQSTNRGSGHTRETNQSLDPRSIPTKPITNHQSPITSHQSPITNHQSPMISSSIIPLTGRDHFARAGCFQPRSLNDYLTTNQPTNQPTNPVRAPLSEGCSC
jgi:hypothetical protein